MVEDLVRRETEIDLKNIGRSRIGGRGRKVATSSLMFKKFKENVTKQSKERGKENNISKKK